MPTSKLAWVDCARGIGILLVVYGHVADGVFHAGLPFDPVVHHATFRVIYSFHMPLFFLLAGLFSRASWERRGTAAFIRNKLDTILYPYLLWSLLQGSVEVMLSRYTNQHASWGEVLQLLWHPRQQFWFLYALFFVFLLACVVYARMPRRWRGVLLGVTLLAHVCSYAVPEEYGPFYYLATNALYFFCGDALRGLLIAEAADASVRPGSVAAGLGMFVLVQVMWLRWSDLLSPWQAELMGAVVALLSIAVVIAASMWLARRERMGWLAVLGAQSLPIYLMHTIFASGVRIVLARLLGIELTGLHLLAGMVAGILLPLLVVRFCDRWHVHGLFAAPRFVNELLK